MSHIVETLRMLGFVGVLGASLAVLSAAGCERNEDVLEIETPNESIDVEKTPEGNLEIDVDDK